MKINDALNNRALIFRYYSSAIFFNTRTAYYFDYESHFNSSTCIILYCVVQHPYFKMYYTDSWPLLPERFPTYFNTQLYKRLALFTFFSSYCNARLSLARVLYFSLRALPVLLSTSSSSSWVRTLSNNLTTYSLSWFASSLYSCCKTYKKDQQYHDTHASCKCVTNI